jgi:hypothetical protein
VTNDKEYRLSASINDGIIEIILSGTVTRTNVSRLQKEIDSLRNEKGSRLLIDVRTLNEGSGYHDVLYYIRRPDKATGKTAILDVPGNDRLETFLKTATLNTHLEARYFSNLDLARNWLKT